MTNGKADEGKTPTEGFLARIKELPGSGTAVAAIVTAVWAATTYLNDKQVEYVKTFSEKQIALSFKTAETVANLLTAETQDACGHTRRQDSAISIGDLWSWLSLLRSRRQCLSFASR